MIGRRIKFLVHAMEGDVEIGRGIHERVVIDLAAFAKQLATKA